MTNPQVGRQLTGQELYEKQSQKSLAQLPVAPRIIATHLKTPENMGKMLRIADAVGSHEVIFVNDPDSVNLKYIRRYSRHSHQSIQWQIMDESEFLLQASDYRPMIALELTTESTSIYKKPFPQECSLVVGNESKGIPSAILQNCDHARHIPMYGRNGSMNVVDALAIAIFEWRRQFSTI